MKYRMIAKTFPAYHPRRGEPTGFADAILTGRKIHTLRNTAGGLKDGDVVSLRQWAGQPYASKQVEFARCVVTVRPCAIDSHGILGLYGTIREVARNDGFDNAVDFLRWFQGDEDDPIDWAGVCIRFHHVIATGEAQ